MTKEQLQWAMYEAYAKELLARIEAQEAEIAMLGTMAGQARADSVTLSASYEQRIEALRQGLERKTQEAADALNKLAAERDGLLVQVQDLREELKQERARLGAIHIALGLDYGDDAVREIDRIRYEFGRAIAKEQELHAATALRLATEAAKIVESKHPVKVGDYVKRLTGFNTTPAGEIGRVTLIDDDNADAIEYEVKRPNGERGVWSAKNCTPCDPPTADHDTPEGKDVAGTVIRDDRKTEPAAELKVGDDVEVFQATAANENWTHAEDIGAKGTVLRIDLNSFSVPVVYLSDDGVYALQDVRKVTT